MGRTRTPSDVVRNQSSPARFAGSLGDRRPRSHACTGFRPENGEELWTWGTKSSIDGSPVIVGDRVYVGGGDGRVYGLNLASGEKLWEYEAGGDFVGSPAVAGRAVGGGQWKWRHFVLRREGLAAD